MKCIRIEQKGQKKVVRCADDLALELVADGRAEFCPKSEWKEDGRKYYSEERRA